MIDFEENHMVQDACWRDWGEYNRRRAEALAEMADDELDEMFAESVDEFEWEMEYGQSV